MALPIRQSLLFDDGAGTPFFECRVDRSARKRRFPYRRAARETS